MRTVLLTIKVIPNARINCWKITETDLKCYLTAPAIDGKANQMLVKRLAKLLKLPMSKITIVRGALTRTKTIAIETELTYEEVFLKLQKD